MSHVFYVIFYKSTYWLAPLGLIYCHPLVASSILVCAFDHIYVWTHVVPHVSKAQGPKGSLQGSKALLGQSANLPDQGASLRGTKADLQGTKGSYTCCANQQLYYVVQATGCSWFIGL